MRLKNLFESVGLQTIQLSASQQRTALRMANVPRDKWPSEDVVFIAGENGSFNLALEDESLGPKAFWNGTEWSPL